MHAYILKQTKHHNIKEDPGGVVDQSNLWISTDHILILWRCIFCVFRVLQKMAWFEAEIRLVISTELVLRFGLESYHFLKFRCIFMRNNWHTSLIRCTFYHSDLSTSIKKIETLHFGFCQLCPTYVPQSSYRYL